MDKQIKDKIIKMVVEGKVPLKELASKLFMTEKQLRFLVEDWGVEIPRKTRRYITMSTPPREELMQLYKKYGKLEDIAKHYQVGYSSVYRWFRDLAIPTKKMKMSPQKKVKFLEQHLGRIKF